MIAILWLWLFASIANSTPQIAFPFNAQVPQVAKVGQWYNFTLSPSTFRTNTGAVTYSLAGAPSWLQLDASNGTLFGTPGQGDNGTPGFTITGTDDTGSANMAATLVVGDDGGPWLGADLALTLAKAGTRSGPTSLLYPPQTPITIDLSEGIFISGQKPVSYYATMSDHTPLPAWIIFDPKTLHITGTTPTLNNIPAQFDINVIASDVPGFCSVKVSFTIFISDHQFLFGSVEETLNIPAGDNVNLTTLKSQLQLDGKALQDQDFTTATALLPSWLQFDSQTMALTGMPPKGTSMQNVTITAQDKYGDSTIVILRLNLGFGRLYTGYIGVLNLTAGKDFNHTFSRSDFVRTDLDISMDLGVVSRWLTFDQSSLTIQGTVPSSISPQTVQANMTITTPDQDLRDFQAFEFQVVAPTNETTNAPGTSRGLSKKTAGIIAGIVIAVVFGIICIVFATIWCRLRRDKSKPRRPSVFKRMISRPFTHKSVDADYWTSDQAIDQAEHDDTLGSVAPEYPPKVELNFPVRAERSPVSPMHPAEGTASRSWLPKRFSMRSQCSPISPMEPEEEPTASKSWLPKRFSQNRSKASLTSLPTDNRLSWTQNTHLTQDYAPGVPNALGVVMNDAHYDAPPYRQPPLPQGSRRFRYAEPLSSSEMLDRTPYSVSESIDTDILDYDHHMPSSPPIMPTPVFQLPARNSLYDSPSNGRRNSSRPLPRRGPHRSSFFAGGSFSRGRTGIGLSTIDGSPDVSSDLDSPTVPSTGTVQKKSQLVRAYTKGSDRATATALGRAATQASERSWETAESTSAGAASPQMEGLAGRRWTAAMVRAANNLRRPASEQNWGRERGRVSERASGRASESGGGASQSSSIYDWTPPGQYRHLSGIELTAALQTRLGDRIPIMERSRAAYRLGMKEKTPLRSLGVNERNIPGSRKLKIKGRMVSEGALGNEAFI
ncbi:hypothetical protein BT63DRAFT_451783 [Microthyrium microscopicum]|uniref:Dystroglycan-type cadherin-like domain-containing protein n=1 Tax=Microthyrium microscopicum TaxID=703497 RepID=A0A6A6US21_9PEZI|nr:hypothetical protein BT63DRAFT_451783 [Microthyrium microscopicum]